MKKAGVFISTICAILMLSTISVFAYNTLMTYSGDGIRGKYSNGTFSINSDSSTFYVDHAQEWWYDGTQTMKITAKRQNWLGAYSISEGYVNVSGDGSWVITYSNKPKGVYKLYFEATDSYNCADIDGSVYQ